MTNGDRIRYMSDEKLAEILSCPNESGQAEIRCKYDGDCDCYECVLNWLRKEETK